MLTDPRHDNDNPLQALMFSPLAHWYAGFDYAYGYQMKLILNFWGLDDDAR